MNPEVNFDAREYFTQSTLEPVAKRLGLEWLNWGVWYKEIGPWRLYVDPWEKQPWMEVEVGMDTGNDQIKVVDSHVSQQAADEVLPAVVDILTKHADHNLELSDNGVGSLVLAVLKPHIVYESEDFDAREYLQSIVVPGEAVAKEYGFRATEHPGNYRLDIGQFIVYLSPGTNNSVLNVYRDFGWQAELYRMFYLGDENVEPVTKEVLGILRAHTNPNGWATDDAAVLRRLEAIPQR